MLGKINQKKEKRRNCEGKGPFTENVNDGCKNKEK
jgi:hypothetical protein